MSLSSFDPLYLFLIVAMASPGPNVILLTTFGAKFGFRAAIAPMLGVVIGVGIIGAATGLGIGSLLNSVPELTLAAKAASASWILWMAWSLFNAERQQGQTRRFRPFTFVEAVLFQWVNPKIWAVALAAIAGFSKGLPPVDEAARLGIAFFQRQPVCLHFLDRNGVASRSIPEFGANLAMVHGNHVVFLGGICRYGIHVVSGRTRSGPRTRK